MNTLNKQTAVFIDGPWLWSISKRIGKPIDYNKFFYSLKKIFGTDTQITLYGGIDNDNNQQKRFYISIRKIGYKVCLVPIFKINNRISVRGLDVNLTVDALSLLPSLKKFILISGDNDFAPLLKKINNSGVEILIIALPFSTGHELRKFVRGAFFNLETIINNDLKKLPKFKKTRNPITPKNLYIKQGDSFESYLFIKNLMFSAKHNITIIDPYIDEQILTMLGLLNKKINIIIFTNNLGTPDFIIQAKKLINDGFNITIYKTNKFHDRIISIDNMVYWHSGHSFKDLGTRYSMLNKITEKSALNEIKDSILKESLHSKKLT